MTTETTPLHAPRHPALRQAAWLGGSVLLLLLAGGALRVFASVDHAKNLATTTEFNAQRSVLTTTASKGDPKRLLALPGTLRGRTEASVYARTNGYLKSWSKDIGDRVHKGDLLAVIDAPETEQELLQARAAREQVSARLGLAESSLARWQDLRQRDAVSQQELDERHAAMRQAQADLSAANANIKRLEQLQSFCRINAPFDGVVVRRNVEVGALIGAGNNGNSRELFHVAQTDPLLVSVAVPQTYVGDIRLDQEVSIKLAERPGVTFKAKVARKSDAVDSDTRSMVVEIELPNPGGKLLPGAYVEVGFNLTGATHNLVVPASALQFRQDGPRLALVGKDQRIVMRTVKLGRDFGKTVEVLSGLSADDHLVLNPHDAIQADESVIATVAPVAKPDAPRPASSAPSKAGEVGARS